MSKRSLINLDELSAKANEKKPLYLSKESYRYTTPKPEVAP